MHKTGLSITGSSPAVTEIQLNTKSFPANTGKLFRILYDRNNYFSDKKSLILSLCTIASLKVYAPDLGLRTALITFVQFLASEAAFWSLVLIAVLAAFAMVI